MPSSGSPTPTSGDWDCWRTSSRTGRRLPWCTLNDAEVDAADAVVLVTDHDAFDLDRVAARASYVLDTRGRISGPNVERL